MKKQLPIIIIVAVVAIGGSVFAYNKNQDDKAAKNAETVAMEKKDGEVMEKKDGEVMVKSGAYVTLADYNADPAKYAETKKVYFFHASWCPICQGIHKEIEADPTKIPAGTTFIKTDFDKETDLRQKYGVNTQYTFVQVDNNGNETAQWSATNLAKAVAGIKS